MRASFPLILFSVPFVASVINNVPFRGLTRSQGFEMLGSQNDDRLGFGLHSAGDFNGDGHPDVLVGVAGSDLAVGDGGAAFIMFSNHTQLTDITAFGNGYGSGIRILGGVADGLFGQHVGGGGDINGDGFDDVVIGHEQTQTTGIVYVFLGYAPSALYTSLNTATYTWGTGGFRIFGTHFSFGHAVAILGDVNGDGYDDIGVGAWQISSFAGKVWVIFGHSTATAFNDITISTFSTGNMGYTVLPYSFSSDNRPNLGYSLAAAGDVNYDGFGDFLIGAPNKGCDPNGKPGAVYIIFGSACGNNCADVNLQSYTASQASNICGEANGDTFGGSVAGAGDVNGDGIDDIVIGAYSRSAAYVIFGSSVAGTFDTYITAANLITASKAYKIETGTGSGYLGWSVDGAGDINADGYSDIIIGAKNLAMYGKTNAGAAFVVLGHSTDTSFPNLLTSQLNSSSNGFSISGLYIYDMVGKSVAGVGDFNQDGVDDVAVVSESVNQYGGGTTSSGALTILYGTVPITWRPTKSPTIAPTAPTAIPTTGPPTAIPTVAPSRAPTASPTRLPTLVPTVSPTKAPTAEPTTMPTLAPTTDPTLVPTAAPSAAPTQAPTVDPTASPTLAPTAAPTLDPTTAPSAAPTLVPSGSPSADPTFSPTAAPTLVPTAEPSAGPTITPSAAPTIIPTAAPSNEPTIVPTADPSVIPSVSPTEAPTIIPTAAPTIKPSAAPTEEPSIKPTASPSMIPSADPTAAPTLAPTTEPTIRPTTAPTAVPTTAAPSAAPTIDPVQWLQVLSSPTYKVRNGFAFAVRTVNGSVYTWGEGPAGGNSSSVAQLLIGSVTSVVPSSFAYAATRSGSTRLAVWGAHPATLGRIAASTGSPLLNLVANEAAFAAIDSLTGAIVALGSKHSGGNVTNNVQSNGYTQQLTTGSFTSIVASAAAFSAIDVNGHVYAWGSAHTGGGQSTLTMPLTNVMQVVATREAFAARTASGRVLCWGSTLGGGDCSHKAAQLSAGIVHLVAARSAFVAFTQTLGIVVWGGKQYGLEPSASLTSLNSGVVYVAHNFGAFAALKADGHVVTWGDSERGGDSSAVQSHLVSIVKLYSGVSTFAAIDNKGMLTVWGKASYGGTIPVDKLAALSTGVVSISHTDRAFAALKTNGRVVAWGEASFGGSPGAAVEALLSSGVHTICANDVAFSAIKTDGSVVSWGHEVSVPSPGVQFTSPALTTSAQCA